MKHYTPLAKFTRSAFIPLLSAITLSACGGSKAPPLPDGTVGVRITSAVETGVTAERITVIPNDVAPWVSQILVLADGQIYRTSATGGKAQNVNAGSVKDIIGLMRKGQAGTALTLTQEGQLTGLIEKDDEGRLARMNVSAKANRFDGFCQSLKAPIQTLSAFAGKDLVTLEISYDGDEVMRVTETARRSLGKPITACLSRDEDVLIAAGGQLYAGSTALSTVGNAIHFAALGKSSAPTLLVKKAGQAVETFKFSSPNKTHTVLVEDGMSISGSDSLGAVFATADSLGGTFNDGALIIQDEKTKRLILINKTFAENSLRRAP